MPSPLHPARFYRVFSCTLCLLILALLFSSKGTAAVKPKVILLPFQIFAGDDQQAFLRQGLRSMFISRLTGEGLDLVPEETTKALLTDEDVQGVQSEERAESIARQAGAAYAIFGSVTGLGGGYSLDLAIMGLKNDPPQTTRFSEASNQDQLIPKLAEMAYQFRAVVEGVDVRKVQQAALGQGQLQEGEGTMGLFFSPTGGAYGFQPSGFTNLRTLVYSFDAGDLDGDGSEEVLLVTREKLLVSGRENETMVLKDQLEARTGEVYVHVSVGDMTGDGKDEIYLASFYGSRVQSAVYEWSRGGRFRLVADTGGHLNIIKDSMLRRYTLLYQDSRSAKAFSGDIYYMDLQGGSLKRRERLPIEDAQLYTFALADINKDGHQEFIGFDNAGYLNVWSNTGTVLWRGVKKLSGTNNKVAIGNISSPEALPPSQEINSRVMVADIDKNGTREVIVAWNIPNFSMLDQLKLYNTSKLLAYKVEGSTLQQGWITQEIRYAMADIQQVKDTIYVVGHEGQYSKISSGKSRIMWFE